MKALTSIAIFLVLIVSCDWSRPYIQRDYEYRIGRKLVALNDQHLIEYETGRKIDGVGRKRDANNRKLYYTGIRDSTIHFTWLEYDVSETAVERTINKVFLTFALSTFPFTIRAKGFLITIHDADHHQITYTIVSANPLDLTN